MAQYKMVRVRGPGIEAAIAFVLETKLAMVTSHQSPPTSFLHTKTKPMAYASHA